MFKHILPNEAQIKQRHSIRFNEPYQSSPSHSFTTTVVTGIRKITASLKKHSRH